MRLKTLFLFTLFIFSSAVYAEVSAKQTLQSFLSKLNQMSGEFTQLIVSEQGKTIRSATGIFKIKKPGMFDWQYKEPYSQQIVSNGQKIWIHDEDLEQVSIRQVSESLNSSPLSIFVSDSPIENIFVIGSQPFSDDANWIRLTPKEENSSFQYIDIGFKNNKLYKMALQDNFGQTTRLLFTQIAQHSPINATDFEFIVPEGADVFEEQ